MAAEAKRRLSPDRFHHVEGVVEAARALAERFGVDPAAAERAAWLHDVYRETAADELKRLAASAGIKLPEGPAEVWHGPVCAALMPAEFGIADPAVRAAVEHHTAGHPEMDALAQVLFVADAIEPGRAYPGVEELRRAAASGLRLATALAADASIAHLLRERRTIVWQTVALRNRLWLEIGGVQAVVQ